MQHKLLLAGLLFVPWLAQADDFDYSYVEGGIANANVDVGPADVDIDGLIVGVSFAVTEELHVFGSYEDQDFDFGSNGNVLTLGGGFHVGLSQDLDFVGDLAYIEAEVATPFGSADDSGYAVGAGLRSRLSDAVEIDAGIRYVDLDETDTLFSVGARYYFTDALALGGAYTNGDDGSSWSVRVRYRFATR